MCRSRPDHLRGGRRRFRPAFTLVEALIALSITSLAGAVLLLSVQSSLDSTIEAVQRTIADGVAQQTIDEIVTKRFTEQSEDPLTGILGPLVNEVLNGATALFDDADDYAGYIAQPLRGLHGEILGTGDDNGNLRLQNFRVPSDYFQNWRVRVDVFYVDPANHLTKSAAPTNFRAIEVHVELIKDGGKVVPLATRRRVVCYLPPPS
jgi:type II secretory pathway pseudopilin PulG